MFSLKSKESLALFASLVAALVIGGCAQSSIVPDIAESAGEVVSSALDTGTSNEQALQAALDTQSDDHKARYDARNPGETLAFFGIEPGMTVAEALPGGGWYTKVLASYLGGEGTIYGVNYQESVWASFGMPEERVADRVAATEKFASNVAQWNDNGERCII